MGAGQRTDRIRGDARGGGAPGGPRGDGAGGGIAFHCRPTGGELRLSAEHDASEWVPLERLAAVPVTEPLRGCLLQLTNRRR
jgi:hypothetical protein